MLHVHPHHSSSHQAHGSRARDSRAPRQRGARRRRAGRDLGRAPGSGPRHRRLDPRPGHGMNAAPARRASDERGLATIQYVFAVGISFILLVLVANLLVDLYARAAVRDALEEGTRAGVPIDAEPAACGDRAREVLHGLLRGPIGDDIRVRCDTAAGCRRGDGRGPAALVVAGTRARLDVHGPRGRGPRSMSGAS